MGDGTVVLPDAWVVLGRIPYKKPGWQDKRPANMPGWRDNRPARSLGAKTSVTPTTWVAGRTSCQKPVCQYDRNTKDMGVRTDVLPEARVAWHVY